MEIYNSLMLARLTFASILIMAGVVLGVAGLLLWRFLPMAMTWPPFGLTALLAVACGTFDFFRQRRRRRAESWP